MDCNTYSASVPCNPADKNCGEPPHPPPPPPGPPGRWSPAHNCTSCGNDASLADFVNLDLITCQRQCKANPQCSYITWVVPAGNGQCSLFAQCGEQCLPDHCWGEFFCLPHESRSNAHARTHRTHARIARIARIARTHARTHARTNAHACTHICARTHASTQGSERTPNLTHPTFDNAPQGGTRHTTCFDRPSGAPWNKTACDSLPEKPGDL